MIKKKTHLAQLPSNRSERMVRQPDWQVVRLKLLGENCAASMG